MKDVGVLADTVNKRLSKGMRISTPAVRTLMFDTTNFEAIQMDVMVAPDAYREHTVQG